MASSSLPSHFLLMGLGRHIATSQKARMPLRATSHNSSGEEGKPSVSIVDANLGVLKERVERMKVEERMERWGRDGVYKGWDYQPGYKCEVISRRNEKVAESLEIARLVVGTAGLTILTCTLCLCLVSFVVHLG